MADMMIDLRIIPHQTSRGAYGDWIECDDMRGARIGTYIRGQGGNEGKVVVSAGSVCDSLTLLNHTDIAPN